MPLSNVKAACGGSLERLSLAGMAKSDDDRAKRLAEALRQNLRRRKAQARGTEERPEPGPRGDGDET